MTVTSKRIAGVMGAAAAALATVAGAGSAASSAPSRAQAPPRELEQPRIVGALRDGNVVRADEGRWSNNPTSFAYRWQRCGTRTDTTCGDIPGATARTYRISTSDVGRFLRVWVTACNRDGCTSANSRPRGPVAGTAAPRNTRVPAISGSPVVGQTLSADPGTWEGGVARLEYQWQRCDANGANCSSIPGATRQTYVVAAGDVGTRLRVAVTARNSQGSSTAVSAPTDVVRPAGPAGAIRLPSGETSIPVSSVAPPNRLIVTAVRFSPNPVRSRSAPITVRVRVADTRGFVVRDALVFVRSTPLVTSTPAEGASATDGWATFQTLPERDFGIVFRRGYNLQFFVRARKAGENPLAGVSTRRLVQVRIFPG